MAWLGALALAQSLALVVLVIRLLPGRSRRPPVVPVEDQGPPRVSVLLPTFNEAHRVQPCLDGLMQQGPTVHEILVVDGDSRDGTVALARAAGARDPRVRVTLEPPLPNGWIGKVWALQVGFEQTSGDWVMNVDADIDPRPGLVAAAIQVAAELDLSVVSFSPRFDVQNAAEQWLQAALLVTLVYRTGAVPSTGVQPAQRVLANGQCFLARRDVLLAHGGYSSARRSFSDDVTLARHLAKRGVRVGFLDGSRLFSVRSYESLGQLWHEWGRSLALKDATPRQRLIMDVVLLALVQGLPLFAVLWSLVAWLSGSVLYVPLLLVNSILLTIRVAMLGALAISYSKRYAAYWLSPLADPLAVVRIIASALRRPTSWRGRSYAQVGTRPVS